VPAGRTADQSVITMDWTATMLGLAGAASDPGYPLDGVDLTQLCLGKPAQFDRALFWRTRAQGAARRGRWKYLRIGGDEMLYDIPNDPGERADLDIYQPRALASLREEFRRWNDQMLPRPAPNN
jgi:arylsulfatase A-like enzyme